MLLIIAMVVSAAVMKAYEQGKVRTHGRWEEARRRAEERGAQREREQQARAAAWSAWFDKGVSTGPRHPLWWAYAVGWTTGGAIAAVGAGAVGAYSGAITGATSGYAIGREAGRAGRKYGETYRAWRKANWGKNDPVELGICLRCGGWISKSRLSTSPEYGQVCPDCVPTPSASNSPKQGEEHNDASGRSDTGDDEPVDAVHEWKATRCECGRPVDESTTCDVCAAKARKDKEQQSDEGPIWVDSERIYPDQEENPQPKESTNTMAELMPGNSSDIAATGEGLNDTLNTLNALAKLLNKAHEEMTNLGDNLTANSLDAATLGRINELNDLLDTAAPMATELHRHVENRHNPIADAMAAAGGSSNVASKTFYDDH